MNNHDKIRSIRDRFELMKIASKGYGGLTMNAGEFPNRKGIRSAAQVYSNPDNSIFLPRLFEEGILRIDHLAEGNITNSRDLMKYRALAIFLSDHETASDTARIWNSVARRFRVNMGTCMAVIEPENLRTIMDFLRYSNKFLGGGLDGSLKEVGYAFIKGSGYGFVSSLASETGSTDFLVHLENSIIGYNAEILSFVSSIRNGLQAIGKSMGESRLAVIGSSPSSKAISLELARQHPEKIYLYAGGYRFDEDYISKIGDSSSAAVRFCSDEEELHEIVSGKKVDLVFDADSEVLQWSQTGPSAHIAWKDGQSAGGGPDVPILMGRSDLRYVSPFKSPRRMARMHAFSESGSFSHPDERMFELLKSLESLWILLGPVLEDHRIGKEDVLRVMMESM